MRRIALLSLWLALPAAADCWTVSSPAKFSTSTVPGAVKYEWIDQTGAVLATTAAPSAQIPSGPNTTPAVIQWRIVDAAGARGPLAAVADPVYITSALGTDLDGNGDVTATDFTSVFIQTYIHSCKSCVSANQKVSASGVRYCASGVMP